MIKEVNVLEHIIDITTEWDELFVSKDNLGACAMMHQLIYIKPNLPHDVEMVTLIHELIHVIETVLDFSLSEEDVDKLALGFLSLCRNNPELVKEICR